MKISEYPKTSLLADGDSFILEGANTSRGTLCITSKDLANVLGGGKFYDDGTDLTYSYRIPVINNESASKMLKMTPSDFYYKLMDTIMPNDKKRSIIRGNNLGSSVTSEQQNAIKAGTFKGIFVGDYWQINNINWRIVDFDYWKDYNTDQHHVVIMPDELLTVGKIKAHATRTFTGGIYNMDLLNSTMIHPTQYAREAFGQTNIIPHWEILSNGFSNGHVTSYISAQLILSVPNEVMIYGTKHFSSQSMDRGYHMDAITVNKSQLAITEFGNANIRSTIFGNGFPFWLSDFCDDGLLAVADYVSVSHYVDKPMAYLRPIFALSYT